MKTRALLSVLGASVVLLTAAGAAHANGNQVIPGSDLILTETYGYDGNGDYHAEDRTGYRDLDSDSPAELMRVGYPSGVWLWVNTTADPKGCFDDYDPSDCSGGAITLAGEIRHTANFAVRLDSDGTAELYAEDATDDNVIAGAFNDAADATNPDYNTAGDDDDGHDCGNANGHCDDETNVLISLP